MTTFLEVQHAIPPEVETAVRQAIGYAMKRLRLTEPVTYRFFVGGAPGDAARWHSHTFRDPLADPSSPMVGAVFAWEPSTIWIRADLAPRDAAHAALHECVHVLECQTPESGLIDEWERMAIDFADAHIERSLRP